MKTKKMTSSSVRIMRLSFHAYRLPASRVKSSLELVDAFRTRQMGGQHL